MYSEDQKTYMRTVLDALLRNFHPQVFRAFIYDSNLFGELAPGFEHLDGASGGSYHQYDVLTHILETVALASHSTAFENDLPKKLLLYSALFHDIGKVTTRCELDNGGVSFHGHDTVGAEITEEILTSLGYPEDFVEKVVWLVRYHMAPQFGGGHLVRKLLNDPLVETDGYILDVLLELKICDICAGHINQSGQLVKLKDFRDRIDLETVKLEERKRITGLAIQGRDLIALGVKEGRAIGDILEECACHIEAVGKKYNVREHLLEYVQKLI